MAFWGIEVKPGKPVTHSSECTSGRLRISQATLGIGEARKKCIVQCNVGNRSPILLCILSPNRTESLQLDLEFEEADDVVFSVIGPRSVFLAGYYSRKSHQSNLQSDTESFGVDIENSQNDVSSYRSDDDKYDDSFINDDENLQVSPKSPLASSKEMDGITPENDKPKDKKGRSKQLKKKHRVIESDSDAKSLETEEEDAAFTLSGFKINGAIRTSISDVGEKIAQVTEKMGDEAKDDGTCGSQSNQKVDPLDINDQSQRETKLPMDDEGAEDKNEENEFPKEVQSVHESMISNEVSTDHGVHGNNSEDININQNMPINNEKDQMQPLEFEKPNKKRKRSTKAEKPPEITIDKNHNVRGEDKEHEIEASTNAETGVNCVDPTPELGSEDCQKSKKKKSELQVENTEVIGERCRNINGDDKIEQNLLQADGITGDLPAENGVHHEQQNDENINTKPESLSNGTKSKKKSKKKKKKTHGDDDPNMKMPISLQDDNQMTTEAPIQKMLQNGLIIEELAIGPPKAKVAAPGKKVKIYYTGMLKDSERVFDSNVDKTAFKFRLGDEEYIDGWNVGIDGMRVGGKRRLIIPPHLGFGDHALEEKVPPNSWLVYDVELVSVRR